MPCCLQAEAAPLSKALAGAETPEGDDPASEAAACLQAAHAVMQQVGPTCNVWLLPDLLRPPTPQGDQTFGKANMECRGFAAGCCGT